MNLRYEKASTPRTTYVVYLDDKPVAVVSMTRSRQWVATNTGTTMRTIAVPACATRHEATMALIGRLADLGALPR